MSGLDGYLPFTHTITVLVLLVCFFSPTLFNTTHHAIAMRAQTHQPVPDDRARDGSFHRAKLPTASVTALPASTYHLPSASRVHGQTAAPPAPPARTPSVIVSEGTFLFFDDAPIGNNRDSFSSIVDDPFFARFDAPRAPSPLADSNPPRHDPQPTPFPPRKESLSDQNPTPWVRYISGFSISDTARVYAANRMPSSRLRAAKG